MTKKEAVFQAKNILNEIKDLNEFYQKKEDIKASDGLMKNIYIRKAINIMEDTEYLSDETRNQIFSWYKDNIRLVCREYSDTYKIISNI